MKTNPEEFIKFNELIKEYNPYYMIIPPKSKIRNKTFKRESFEVCLSMMKRGYNVAVLAGDGNPLVFIDIDYAENMTEYKQTLKCISGSGRGYHLIYVSDDPKVRFNCRNDDIGDMHADRKYIICPGSRIEKGSYYIANHIPPVTITFDELPEAFRKSPEANQQDNIKNMSITTSKNNSVLDGLKMEDIFSYPENKNFASPFHGSDGGLNTRISKGLLHCYRCNVYHTPKTALAVLSGQIECSDGFKHGGDKTLNKEINDDELFVWAVINGYIKEE